MYKIFLVIIFLFNFSFIAQAQKKEYKMVWHDEFNEKSLDTTQWNYVINGNGGGNNELQYYTNSPENVYLKDGHLYIVALKKSYKGKLYTSARIDTKGKEDFKYGRFEMRAKIPVGRGTWPAFWLLGQDIGKVGWPACGEVDIMEEVGFDPLWNHGSIHTPSSYGSTVNTSKIKVPDSHSKFHIYGVTWTPNKISFFIDNPEKPYYTYNPKIKNASTWPFNKPLFIILNLAIGGNWGGKMGIDNSTFPTTMEVDYVRVFQLK
ncbi:MAG: glycoside hydrolase family 16 protein [Bacteroidales bacterium]|nr:glycoside hydrolase family 16 protein [Bacteroidales bacterium]